jgi:hypothetical protein
LRLLCRPGSNDDLAGRDRITLLEIASKCHDATLDPALHVVLWAH